MRINWSHPKVRIGLWILAGVLVFVIGWFLITRIFPDDDPGPTKGQTQLDSLAITKPHDEALLSASNTRIQERGAATLRAEAAARASQDVANRERTRANSLAALAEQASDKAKAWKDAHDARLVETNELRTTIASNNTTIMNLKADTTELRFQLKITAMRLKTTEDVAKQLSKDIENLKHCKILGLVKCPSRIQTAAGTAILTFVAFDRYQRR